MNSQSALSSTLTAFKRAQIGIANVFCFALLRGAFLYLSVCIKPC